MTLVVSFVSQKGGVGKSTLARAVAVAAAAQQRSVLLADLDPQQLTVMAWGKLRGPLSDGLRIEAFGTFQEALVNAKTVDVLVLDTPGRICDETTNIARNSHLIVQPTSPSVDDLQLSMLVFQALGRVGIPQERLVFVLSRVLTHDEGEAARSLLLQGEFAVVAGAIPEHIAFREAMKVGRAITETTDPTLNASSQALARELLGLLDKYRPITA